MKTLLAGISGVIFAALGLAALLGWLSALIWNHFPFLETLHHMSLWDGFLFQLLCGLLFKSNSTSSSK